MIDILEARIAPATLVNSTTVIYQDLDGDDVTVKFSLPLFAGVGGVATANQVLDFDAGTVDDDPLTLDTPQQLQVINLSGHIGVANGVGFTVTAVRNAIRGGDGYADVGHINAAGIDLGVVGIAGDLGAIDAGDQTLDATSVALQSLTVQSLGELGLSTGATDLISNLDGSVGTLTIKGHLRDAQILVKDTLTDPILVSQASVGSLVIGGSIIGGADNSGSIQVDNRIETVSISGDLRGGAGPFSGVLKALRSMGEVTIGGSIVGSGANSGRLETSFAFIDSVSIGGDIRGGTGAASGAVSIDDSAGAMRTFSLGGSLIGGAGIGSGRIDIDEALSAFSINGDVLGGSVDNTGQVVLGGDTLGSLFIGGSIRAGAGDFSGRIAAAFTAMDSLLIAGSIDGAFAGAGSENSARVQIASAETLTLGGSLVGGTGANSGYLQAVTIGTLAIAGSVLGGGSDDTGTIFTTEGFGIATIGGSVVGGTGLRSGRIDTNGALDQLTIAGDLRGGAGPDSGAIYVENHAGTITVKGSVQAGSGAGSGIFSDEDISTIIIGGSLAGSGSQIAVISAAVNPAAGPTELVLGSVTIGGRGERALIRGGYGADGSLVNGDAQIGSVTVNGDWIASSIAAGVEDGADNQFGTADDQAIVAGGTAGIASRIGSVLIKGQALGTPSTASTTDAFGIVAEEIGFVKVGTVTESLTIGIDAVPLGATADFIAREDVVGAEVVLPTLVGTTTVDVPSTTLATWTDVDGDLVTLTTTKPLLDLSDFIFVPSGAGIQVQRIEWTDDASDANQGVGITITATPQLLNADAIVDGDGSVNIGYLSAIGLDLGAVKIAGDLGRLEAGDAIFTDAATGAITVQSIGAFGKSTQIAASNFTWQLLGSVPSITVRGDILFADISVSGTGGGDNLDNGTLGKLIIGGSLRGGSAVADGGLGFIGASGNIGSITVGGDIVAGSMGVNSARIQALGAVGAVKVGGSILGGGGKDSGQITGFAGIKSATIGRDIRGGGGELSGALNGGPKLGKVTIAGSLIGGSGEESGSLVAEDFGGSIKSVKIGGDVRGGSGEESAYIHAGQKVGKVTIAGSLIGGGGPNAGDGDTSALIYGGSAVSLNNSIASVTIGGDVLGGTGENSANIGSVFSNAGSAPALTIGKIAVKGSIVGAAQQSAAITAGVIKSITIGGSLRGADFLSGRVEATTLSKMTIGGSVVGGLGNSAGSLSVETLGSLSIGHDLRGGDGSFSGQIFVNLGGAKKIIITGSLESGIGTRAGSVNVNAPLANLTIKGSVWGTAADPALILARGKDMKTSPLALGKLTIGGSAEFLDVLGGFLDETQPLNSDANLGKILIGGTWRAGDIVAGVKAGSDGEYGTSNDEPGTFGNDPEVYSKIASILIKGRVFGTVGGLDDYGFSAEQIGSVKVGAVSFTLKAGPGNDNDNLPAAESARLRVSSTGDFRIHEVPISM